MNVQTTKLYTAIVLLILVLAGCSNSKERLNEVEDSVQGCYSASGFPLVQVTEEKIIFDEKTVSTNFEYSTAGRTADTLISIRPRVYLTRGSDGDWIYGVVPYFQELGEKQGRDYSAQWAIIPEGEQGQSLNLISLAHSVPELSRVSCNQDES